MTVLLDSPDIFGHTIFCDDIRLEVGGKVTYVGAYTGTMNIHAMFPVTLPKFAIAIFFNQKKEIFTANLGLRIFMPGDTQDKASIEGEVEEIPSGVAEQNVIENSAPDKNYTLMGTSMVFAPFIIKEPGLIKVRVLRDSKMHRLGVLRVVAVPIPTQQPPTG